MPSIFKFFNIPLIRSVAISLFILAIGLAGVGFNLTRNPIKSLHNKNFTAVISSHSIDLYTSNFSEPVMLISPQDDFYYNSSRTHVLDKISFREASFLDELDTLMFNNKLVWGIIGNSDKKRVKIVYEIVKEDENSVKIIRKIPLKQSISSVGQSFKFCQNCLVKDNLNRIYMTNEFLTNDRIELAQDLKLTPVIINDLLPFDISTLYIIDSQGKTKIELPIKDNQEVYYQEKWHMLELKTFIVQKDGQDLSQIVKF